MKTLSLNMIVKNEEDVLARCLDSVVNLVDEIIIVDTGSTDYTVEVAKSYGCKVFHFEWTNSFSDARNFSLSKSSCDWHLVLDADEYVVGDASNVIKDFINNKYAIGRIKIINKFSDEKEIKYSQAFVSRLFPNGIKYTGRIHEQLDSNLMQYKVDVEVHHDGYYLKDKTSRNIQLLLQELEKIENNNDSHLLYLLAKECKISKQYAEAAFYFQKCYEVIEKYSSFRPNLIVDYLYTLLELKKFDEALKIINVEYNYLNDFTDFHYVCAIIFMEASFYDIQKYGHLFPRISQEYYECIKIGETNKYDSVLGTGSFLAMYNLGTLFESSGNIEKALEYYRKASKLDYEPAMKRLELLQSK